VRHAKATEIGIHLTIGTNYLKLIVQDNGCGADDFNKNYGLTGIEERINSLGGIVEFESKKNNGFIIEVSIPIS
jgi:signal transduction histidine kinase